MPPLRLPPRLAVAGAAWVFFAVPVRADAPAPSLAARTDPARPYVAHGLATDLVAQGLGAHALRLDLSLGRALGALVVPGWHREGGALLGLGITLHPLGEGLAGLELALRADGRWIPAESKGGRDRFLGRLSLELGYRLVVRGAQLGAAAGVRLRPGPASRWGPVLRLWVGWAV
ncbi:MAG: hypothetical protein AAGH15_27150 [Myxococcota bacterium]